MPWPRHTTIGVAQISHSAIQQMSSSWYQGVMRGLAEVAPHLLVGLARTTDGPFGHGSWGRG